MSVERIIKDSVTQSSLHGEKVCGCVWVCVGVCGCVGVWVFKCKLSQLLHFLLPLDHRPGSLTRCINCGWTNVSCAFHSCATASARGSLGMTNLLLRGVRR